MEKEIWKMLLKKRISRLNNSHHTNHHRPKITRTPTQGREKKKKL